MPDNEFDLADFSEDEQRRVDEYMHRLHQNSDNESEGGADNDDDDNLPLFLHRRGIQRLDLDWAEDNYRPRANQTEFVQPVGPTREHDGRMTANPLGKRSRGLDCIRKTGVRYGRALRRAPLRSPPPLNPPPP